LRRLLFLALLLATVCEAQNAVSLSWDASTTPGVTYNVYRKTGLCSGPSTLTKLNSVPVTALTFADLAAPFGRVCYVVRAEIDSVESVDATLAVTLPPAPPTNLRKP
jgi:hypothetical protein